MFTETVPSRRTAMESKAASTEHTTKFNKNDANINAIHILFFLYTNYRLQKTINEILSALKQRIE